MSQNFLFPSIPPRQQDNNGRQGSTERVACLKHASSVNIRVKKICERIALFNLNVRVQIVQKTSVLTSSAALAVEPLFFRDVLLSRKVLRKSQFGLWSVSCIFLCRRMFFPSCATFEACSEVFCLFAEPNHHVFGLGECF